MLDAEIYWHCLPNVVRDGDGDQTGAANAAIGRIESVEINLARFRKEERCSRPLLKKSSRIFGYGIALSTIEAVSHRPHLNYGSGRRPNLLGDHLETRERARTK